MPGRTRDPPAQLELNAQPAAAPPEPRVYPVSRVVHAAARELDRFFGELWVEGEVSNLRVPASGHLYFTLKDSRAQLSVVIFRTAAARLRFRLADGQLLRCRGHLTVYEAQGRFQLTADAAEPSGMGALQLAFAQLKEKLAAEGLFAEERKRTLPRFPRTIAVVTSRTGAALQDILRVLEQRCPVRVLVCPTLVQGEAAAPEIAAAIRRADAAQAELMIVARGGGSIEDLWAFNTEEVARAIFAARTPVLSAVGHEVDVTIADLVADRRAPTPSAAAEVAVPALGELRRELQILHQRLGRAAGQQLRDRALQLERTLRRLGSPRGLVERRRMLVDDAQRRAQEAMARRIADRQRALAALRIRLSAQQPQARLQRDRALLEARHQRLVVAARARLELGGARLAQLAGRLAALSPLAVLARGYSVVLDDEQRVVRDAATVDEGDALQIRLHRGALRCRVLERALPRAESGAAPSAEEDGDRGRS